MAETSRISREDVEAKFAEFKSDVENRTKAAKDAAMPFAIIAGIVFLLLAYLVGKRVGKKKSSIVEIRRI